MNRIIVSSHHMFTQMDQLTWVDMGGGCYIKHMCKHEDMMFRTL